ncbi:LuxR C-terminal-related transcriptional regulator [Citricoccus sp.]|uniref:helix-turn-helix transcriptional regulator n=1 Tax=Citricoccus sp. TaxID=1978372 RepID=UPI0028BD4EDE|nr:LuxR C-terminal-related transcriptional regulator [Citricoccus sp.]
MALLSLPDPDALPHPALPRFRDSPDAGERLLVVRAPAGTEAQRFAHGWAGGPDRILPWPVQNGQAADTEEIISRVGALLKDPDAGRVAVVADQGAPVGRLAAAFPARLAGPRDVLLTEGEILSLAADLSAHRSRDTPLAADHPGRPPLPLTPRRIHLKTGGWFLPVAILLADPLGVQTARQSLFSALMRWLHPQDADGSISQAGYLPQFTEEVIDAFRPQGFGAMPSPRDLESLGLLVRDGTGGWFMPWLVQDCLRDAMQEGRPDRVAELNRAVDEALAATGHIEAVVQRTVFARDWNRLEDLLLEHWADLFVWNEPALASAVNSFPRAQVAGIDVTEFLPGLLNSTDPDTVPFSVPFTLPAQRPDFARDEALQRLRAETTRLYRTPDRRALTLGTIEVAYLRRAGLFTESADSAVRLNVALSAALSAALPSRQIRPVMAAFVGLQAGISLHLADRLAEAKSAYEKAFLWSLRSSAEPLIAEVAGKLALLSIHQGNTDRARFWVAKVERPLATVRWARNVAAFAADVASAHLALTELDLETARLVLDQLPADLDTDEFWASHAALLVRAASAEGRGADAARWVLGWRLERPAAVQSPLADRILSEAFHAARIGTGDLTVVPGWDRSQELADLEALRCLLKGDPDSALRALRTPERTGQRNRTLSALLGLLARTRVTPATVTESVVRQMASIHHRGGALVDLSAFHALGWTPVFRRAGLVDDAGLVRLERLTRPALVEREVPALTSREREVLQSLQEGMTRREIAESTYRSENTIKGQIRSLYAKLGASSAAEAVEQARTFGL